MSAADLTLERNTTIFSQPKPVHAERRAAGPQWQRGLSALFAPSPRVRKAALRRRSTASPSTRDAGGGLTRRDARRSYATRSARRSPKSASSKGTDGLVRLALKRPFGDGTVAVEMEPLSLCVA